MAQEEKNPYADLYQQEMAKAHADAGYPTYQGAPDDRNEFQKRVDAAATPESNATLGGKLTNLLGVGPTKLLASPVAHPVQTVQGVGQFLSHPIAGAQQFADEFEKDPYSNAVPLLAATATRATPEAGNLVGAVGERVAGYKSPLISPALQNASRVAKAIHPVEGIGPRFESDIAEQMPFIRHFGQESGNPMHSQQETALAARGLGEQGLGHYNTQLLAPHANVPISMRTVPEYQGPVSGEGRVTTLGQLNQRLSDINDLTRGALRGAKTTGQELTAMERQGLEAEGGKVRDILHSNLSNLTGVPEADIQALRQGYGRQFGIADAIDAARRQRLGQGGLLSEGGNIPLNKTDAIGQLMTALRGGREFLANRNLRNAAERFEPQQISYPQPRTIEQPPYTKTAPETAPTEPPKATLIQPPQGYAENLAAKMRGKAENIAQGKQQAQAKSEANVASSQARKEGLTPTEPPQATPVEPPANYAQDFVNRLRQRAGENRALPSPEAAQEPRSTSPMDKYLTGARERQGLLRKEKK